MRNCPCAPINSSAHSTNFPPGMGKNARFPGFDLAANGKGGQADEQDRHRLAALASR